MALKQDMIKVFDATAGRAFCRVAGRMAPAVDEAAAPRESPRRVLVIRPGGIGDAVLVVPMLRAIRDAWPAAELDLLLERRNAGVLRDTGLADGILLYDRILRDLPTAIRRGYDLVIDTEQYHRLSAVVAWLTRAPRRIGFRTNDRERMFTETVPYDQSLYEVHSFLELASAAIGRPLSWNPEQAFFPVSEQARKFTDRVLADLPETTLVAIHPGASIPERRWPTERYARLARMLADD
ncbi:MAG: glycosyltransferase family 9 protein, partial [Acidobacteriota bacterium]|nr:glycosyltransferase family 9 protein [Acidobacteriota bacterium]